MTTYYLATIVKNEFLDEFKTSANLNLIEFVPLQAQESEEEISQEFKKLGMILIGLERLELLESKLKIINDFKNQINS